MRKLLIVCLLLCVWAACAKAQEGPGFEVSGTYQYVRFNPGGGTSGINCQGGSGLFGAYLTSRVGIVGDFGGCKVTGLPSGTTAHELSYLFGPRVYFPTHGRVFPFVQTLFGGERFSAGVTGLGSGSSSAFAMTGGGGADITLRAARCNGLVNTLVNVMPFIRSPSRRALRFSLRSQRQVRKTGMLTREGPCRVAMPCHIHHWKYFAHAISPFLRFYCRLRFA